ncbi:hypothetical protein As57867_015871, partial [Aphanomyces stellatus]
MADSIALKEQLIMSLQDELNSANEAQLGQTKHMSSLQSDLEAARQRPTTDTDELFKKFKIQVEISNEKQTQLQNLRQELDESQHDLQKSQLYIKELRQNAQELTTSLDFSQQEVDAMQREVDQFKAINRQYQLNLQTINSTHDQALNLAQEDTEKWRQLAASFEEKIKALEDEREILMGKLRNAELEHKQHIQTVQDMQREAHHLQLLRRKKQITNVRKEKEHLQQEHLNAEMNMVRLVNEFKFSQQQLETLERNLLEKGCEKNTLEAQIKQLRVAYSDMEQKANTSQHELKEQTEKLTVAQNQVLKQRSQVHSLQNDLKSSKAECEEIEGKLSEQQQTHAKSLEKAMQSLVRLCVVAPTVNVH